MKTPALALGLLALATPALAAPRARPAPAPNLYLEFLETRDLDLAAGAARRLVFDGMEPQLRRKANGALAVVVGPKRIADTQAETQRLIAEQSPAPARYGVAADYGERLAWKRPAPVLARAEIARGKRVRAAHGDLSVELVRRKGPGGDEAPVMIGRVGEKIVFETPPREEAEGAVMGELRLIRLDPARRPVAVLSAFTGGMHCCVVTTLASEQADGGWAVAQGRMLDGDAYDYEDADGDGTFELTSFDNSFLYAFSSYNGSYSPPRVSKLIEGRLVDVTRLPPYRPFLRRSVQALEFGRSDEQWRWPGFLGGWVAAKSLLGEGREAWARMEALAPEFGTLGLELCPDGSEEGCDDDQKRKLSFRAALARHLAQNGYPLDLAARARGAGVVAAPGLVATSLPGLAACAGLTLWPPGGGPRAGRVTASREGVTLIAAQGLPAPLPVAPVAQGEAAWLAAAPQAPATVRRGAVSAASGPGVLAGAAVVDARGAAVALARADGPPLPLAAALADLPATPTPANAPTLSPEALAARLAGAATMISCAP